MTHFLIIEIVSNRVNLVKIEADAVREDDARGVLEFLNAKGDLVAAAPTALIVARIAVPASEADAMARHLRTKYGLGK